MADSSEPSYKAIVGEIARTKLFMYRASRSVLAKRKLLTNQRMYKMERGSRQAKSFEIIFEKQKAFKRLNGI